MNPIPETMNRVSPKTGAEKHIGAGLNPPHGGRLTSLMVEEEQREAVNLSPSALWLPYARAAILRCPIS